MILFLRHMQMKSTQKLVQNITLYLDWINCEVLVDTEKRGFIGEQH